MDRDMYICAMLLILSDVDPSKVNLSDEIREEYAPDRIVLECPHCHARKVLHPYYADVWERYSIDGKLYICFTAKCRHCRYRLTSNLHLDEWSGDVLKEERL